MKDIVMTFVFICLLLACPSCTTTLLDDAAKERAYIELSKQMSLYHAKLSGIRMAQMMIVPLGLSGGGEELKAPAEKLAKEWAAATSKYVTAEAIQPVVEGYIRSLSEERQQEVLRHFSGSKPKLKWFSPKELEEINKQIVRFKNDLLKPHKEEFEKIGKSFQENLMATLKKPKK